MILISNTALLWITFGLVAAAMLLVLLPHRRQPVAAVEFTVEPEDDESRSADGGAGAPPADRRGPSRQVLEFSWGVDDGQQQRLRAWLDEEPAVLTQPAPELHSDGEQTELVLYLRPDLPIEEKARLQARIWQFVAALQ